jgi:cation transport ATPase
MAQAIRLLSVGSHRSSHARKIRWPMLILRKAREEGWKFYLPADFEALTGLGAKGSVEGQLYYVCNPEIMRATGYISGQKCANRA